MAQRFYEIQFTAGEGAEKTHQVQTFRQYCDSKEQQVAEQTAVMAAVRKAIEDTISQFK